MIPLTLLWKPPTTKKSRQSTNLQDFAGEDNKAYHASSSDLNDAHQGWNSRTNKSDVTDVAFPKETLTFEKSENNSSDSNGNTLITTIKKLVEDKAFMYFALGLAAAHSCSAIFFVYVVDALYDSGLSKTSATLGLLLLNLAGWIRDTSGSYTIPFLLSACVEILAIILLCVAQFYRSKDPNKLSANRKINKEKIIDVDNCSEHQKRVALCWEIEMSEKHGIEDFKEKVIVPERREEVKARYEKFQKQAKSAMKKELDVNSLSIVLCVLLTISSTCFGGVSTVYDELKKNPDGTTQQDDHQYIMIEANTVQVGHIARGENERNCEDVAGNVYYNVR
ncbi:hypothetical protein MAR_032037 [Mya arenaria]|uniref:Uncharacterized protein n=1 Tax=Mya arenaria TaxID=6604 RepID=A0ABY7F5I8_MYAAR|nr:hypothetical protein MAR_032037 [Mya arenaria]